MFYVKRDADGRVTALFLEPEAGAPERLESLAADHPDVARFLSKSGETPGESGADGDWVSSDINLARVIEDLILLLLKDETITFADLPAAARDKLISRNERRGSPATVTQLFPEDMAG